MGTRDFKVIVIGGGHAGVEAAWAAANLLPVADGEPPTVALVTLNPAKIGVMSCNPAIGGLAKGQIVREIDALGGLMGLAADATGIQFKVLNTSKGAAVHGPRAQCDKHAYAECVQHMISARPEIAVIAGSVEKFLVERGHVRGVVVKAHGHMAHQGTDGDGSNVRCGDVLCAVSSAAVVLTTGTFMRGLMHTGESKTRGGRFGESAAEGITGALLSLGFELGRLKTGTPPRLSRATIDWDALPDAPGDERPRPFSDLSAWGRPESTPGIAPGPDPRFPSLARFPVLPQVSCKSTSTTPAIHDAIRANIHRAPMYSGQIESIGPRYCPSIEDKVVRFGQRESHNVFLEPESLRAGDDDWVYCNGISTSLPTDVQDAIVRGMPGCGRARVLRYGYAVEYDMVKPHQIHATTMTKSIGGLFLAGQINGTSGYEEAAAQGILAGINAARVAGGREPITIGRDRAYIGVLMDDLATKTPTEPYRMFTSRAEHRLILRSDNAADRLTPLAIELGLLDGSDLGRRRRRAFDERRRQIRALDGVMDGTAVEGAPLRDVLRRPDFSHERFVGVVGAHPDGGPWDHGALFTAHTDGYYAVYIRRQQAEVRRASELERRLIPADMDYPALPGLRAEAREALVRFRPATLGQAARLEGITPADITLLAVLIRKHGPGRSLQRQPEPAGV